MRIYQMEVSTKWSYRMIGVVVEVDGLTLVKYIDAKELNKLEIPTTTLKAIRKATREKTVVKDSKTKLIEITKTYINKDRLNHKQLLKEAFTVYVRWHKEPWERAYPIRVCDLDR